MNKRWDMHFGNNSVRLPYCTLIHCIEAGLGLAGWAVNRSGNFETVGSRVPVFHTEHGQKIELSLAPHNAIDRLLKSFSPTL